MSESAEPAETASAGPSAPRGFDRLAEAFARHGVNDAECIEHEAAYTVDDSRELRGTIPGVHTKNLFLKDKKGRLFLVTAPEEADLDLKTIHTALGGRGRVSFASAELMTRHLGVTPGSVTPLALINDDERAVTCVFHKAVMGADIVNVHPLRNTATVSLPGSALIAILTDAGHPPMVLEP